MENKTILWALKDRLLKLVPKPGKYPTAIDGLKLARGEADTRVDSIDDPIIGVVVQGHKRSLIADVEYRWEEGQFFAIGMDLPSVSRIAVATPETPYLALAIPLDRYILSQLAPGVPPSPLSGARAYRGVTTAAATVELLDAFLRLLHLLDTPERIPVLAPMIIHEIHYFLLIGPEGEDFRLLGTEGSPNNQIARAVGWLRNHYRELFSLAELAGQVNMSRTSFCRHFSRITGMSPLQFQKRLRLYEAQRLMLTEHKSAETAAYEVGYESPTQFNREYKRQFGEPPYRDIQNLITTGGL
ncbi:MAG: AraC family transcriptional regulator [Treponema sp.]|jgi:AraC-like DNA-binding protein|nr:AraC family transcriptional regulator [Treponema sp.]